MPMLEALEAALLHSVWQLGGIAAVLAVALRWRRLDDPNARYTAAVLALFTGVAAFVATLAWALSGPRAATAALPSAFTTSAAPMVGVWALGVTGIGSRHLVGWWTLRRWRAEAVRIRGRWALTLAELATKLGVAEVELAVSSRIPSPAVVGWWRPTILIPLGFLSGLSPRQVEAVLAHELAHIRRYDVLVNLLQVTVETALFYHPAIWWMSRQVRIEREHCCDDLAIAAIGDRKTFARALLDLEVWRARPPTLSVPATGPQQGEGELMSRIKRIIDPLKPRQRSRAWVLPALMSLCVGGLALASACDAEPEPQERAGEVKLWNADDDSVHLVSDDHVAVFIDEDGEKTVLVGDVDDWKGEPMPEAMLGEASALAASLAGEHGSAQVFIVKGDGEGDGDGIHVVHGDHASGSDDPVKIFIHKDGDGDGDGVNLAAAGDGVFITKDGSQIHVERGGEDGARHVFIDKHATPDSSPE